MARVQISFLGRSPKGVDGYRKTRYCFADSVEAEPTAFFGWALRNRIQPERLVILGTSGSMWDHLVETVAANTGDEDLRLELIAATEAKAVSADLLARAEPLLSECVGIPIHLNLIPYGQDEAEQIEILRALAAHVARHDEVVLDVTHGFRHLPMLGLISALYLRDAVKSQIKGIYYGLFDPDTGMAQVYELSGLLHLADWAQAVARYDQSADYGVFVPLLAKDGIGDDKLAALKRAAYYERTFNVSQARQSLGTFLPVLDGDLGPTAALFAPALKERMSWVKSNHLVAHQKSLAWLFLEQRDYPRACIFAQEAFITSLLRADERAFEYATRDKAITEFHDGKRGEKSLRAAYGRLTKFRNAFAHGNRPSMASDATITKDEEKVAEELRSLLDVLLR